MATLRSCLRVTVLTWLVCVVGYTLAVLCFAQACNPLGAEGSLLRRSDGTVVGSSLLAQQFVQPDHFWPRPSAVDFNAAGAGGSNKSPTSPDLTVRARQLVEHYGADPEQPLPADLVAASGSGLDPHITLAAALYQVERIARARHLRPARVQALVVSRAAWPGVVNVLELNLALDGVGP